MELLRELTRLQDEKGWLDEATLRELSSRLRVPLYRLQGLVSFYPHYRTEPPPRVEVHVCRDVVCSMAGRDALTAELRAALENRDDVELCEVSCLGRCDSAPALAVNDQPLAPRTLADVNFVLGLIDSPQGAEPVPQRTPRRWKCDPYDSDDARYGTVRSLVAGGEDLRSICLERLKESGLRGMGGAGFPTGTKWELVSREQASPKYVICNADESEPATFKDRVILAELPHLVIEGMLLAGLAVGAEQGIVYLRHEYSPERQALEAALEQARAAGILGEDASGSGRRFEIQIFVSPGGYILGEETALLEALEDKRGEPRNKPPYPVTHGLWGQPTLINNVETFTLAVPIIRNGADWWRDLGKDECAGLKFVSISGDVEKPDVYEIPVGTTVAELIELAGGMREGKRLKAFLPGGASTNFLPAALADTPLDFESMRQAGSALGTGAVLAIADDRNLYDLATNLVRFFRNESCGKCVPCRVGTEQAVNLLEAVRTHGSDAGELASLTDLGETLEQTSICGLGQVALNPILSMLKHFPDEVPQ